MDYSKVKNLAMNDRNIKKLHYQSWHRGTKEVDCILGRFFDAEYTELSPLDQSMYEQLLNEDDVQLYDWVIGTDCPALYHSIIHKIKKFHQIGL